MKIQSTLPDKPLFLSLVALLDLIVVVFVLTLATTKLGAINGVNVQLPQSQYVMAQMQNMIVLTVTGGNSPLYYLNNKLFDNQLDLKEGLDEYKAEVENSEHKGSILVVLKLDAAVSHGLTQELIDMVLSSGMHCSLATEPKG